MLQEVEELEAQVALFGERQVRECRLSAKCEAHVVEAQMEAPWIRWFLWSLRKLVHYSFVWQDEWDFHGLKKWDSNAICMGFEWNMNGI